MSSESDYEAAGLHYPAKRIGGEKLAELILTALFTGGSGVTIISSIIIAVTVAVALGVETIHHNSNQRRINPTQLFDCLLQLNAPGSLAIDDQQHSLNKSAQNRRVGDRQDWGAIDHHIIVAVCRILD
jgi:hypothetical protein